MNDRCMICGKKERLTNHHVPYEIGTIPLCRNCHDIVEEAKVYVNRMKSMKAAYRKGYEKGCSENVHNANLEESE